MHNESINTRVSFPLSTFLKREINPLACKSVKCVIWQVGKKQRQRRQKSKLPDQMEASPNHLHVSACVSSLMHAVKGMATLMSSMTTLTTQRATFRSTNTEQRDGGRSLLLWITLTAPNIFHFTRIQICYTHQCMRSCPQNVNNCSKRRKQVVFITWFI